MFKSLKKVLVGVLASSFIGGTCYNSGYMDHF